MTTRRRFLRNTALIGAAAVAAPIAYQFRPTTDPTFPHDTNSQGARILVTYASMMGSTGEQAANVAQTLQAAGHAVHLVPVTEAPDPGSYDAVVMGSAIRTDSWLKEMIDWAGQYRDTLANMPAALFQASMTCAGFLQHQDGLTAEQTKRLSQDLEPLFAAAPGLRPKPHAFFPGRIDYDYVIPIIRISYPFVSGSWLFGDHRDPAAVQAWTRGLLQQGAIQKALAPVQEAG